MYLNNTKIVFQWHHHILPPSYQSLRSLSIKSDDSIPEEQLLTVLFKFIKTSKGERSELTYFIQNANSAFSLALPHQKPAPLLYILPQLSANVVSEIELGEALSWEELKQKLKLYYSHTKHMRN